MPPSRGWNATRPAAFGQPFDYTGFVVADFAKARRFYDAIAEALGLGTIDNSPESFLLGRSAEQPIPYPWESMEAVDAFYKAALEAGGRDNGPPDLRPTCGRYYGAFVLDPDGNNIEACFRG